MYNIISFILLVIATIPLYYILKPIFDKTQIPHVPGGNILIGHTERLFMDPVNTLKEFRQKYGSLYSVNCLGKKVIIFGKEWVSELIKNKELEFEVAINEAFLVIETIGLHKYINDPRLKLARIVRTLITPYLKSFNTRIHEQVMCVEKEMFNGQDSFKIDSPAEIMRKMVVKASIDIMFGSRLSKDEEMIQAFYNFPLKIEYTIFSNIKYIIYPIVGRWFARFLLSKQQPHLEYQKIFFEKISGEVELRKREEYMDGYQKPNDLLQRMLDEGYNTEEISLVSLGLVFASIMTTTNNSTLALYDMLTYPEYYNELYEEQMQIKNECGDELNSEILEKMTKLNSFIRETMRIRMGGVANFRITKSDWTLSNGITIPKGSFIAVDAFSLHFDNELKDVNPYEFKPFRHAANGKLATKIEFENISFGLGRNACPGRFLAVQEISTILSVIIRNYKVSTQDGKPHPYMVKPVPFDLPKGEPLIFTKITN